MQFATANREDGAYLDVVARDFWGWNRQSAFFDVRVFNPFAHSYLCSQLSRCYHSHECEKRQAYDARVREVERACFSPLVFAATSGMGPTATTFLGSLLLCWLRITALITASAYSGCIEDLAFIFFDVFKGSLLFY